MLVSRSDRRLARRFSHALIAGSIGLICLVSAAQADVRVGQNYRLTSDPSAFRGKDQAGFAVNPANPQHIVEANANYLTENCEATASFDGGVTWTEAAPLTPPTPAIGMPFLPSCRISNHLGESMFQTVAFGSGTNVYTTAITPRSASYGEEGASALIYKSTDGGVTWGTGVVAMTGGLGGPSGTTPATGPYYELPTVAVDAGAGTGGADRVYIAAHEASGFGNSGAPCPASPCPSVHVAVSADGGATFAAPVQASPAGVAVAGPDSSSEPVIGSDHSVGIAWRTRGITGEVQFARSTNAGATWSAPVSVTGVTNNAKSSASHVTPLPSTGSSFPRLAIDRQNGKLYVVYNQGAPGPTAPAGGYQGADHFISPDSHVYFQRSLDNGATWSTPKLIDDVTSYPGTPTVQTRHPSVAVAPNGRVDVVWQDRRHWYQGPGERNCIHTHLACDDARLGDTYYAYSANGGTTFSANKRITDRSHNNDVGYDYRFGVGWAFGPQAAEIGGDKLLVGWMDSREGSFDSDNEDIYLAKVDLAGPASAAQSSIARTDPIALSVALSKFGYEGGGESLLASTFATRNATRVVIVNQDDAAGALAGAVLARANLGPVLLAPASGLTDSVKSEVARLNPAGAFVIGGTDHLSAQVTDDLVEAGVPGAQVVRLSGPSDAETAGLMAAQMDKRAPAEKAALNPAFDAAVIANPAGPDASAAAALAAARRLPILFVAKDSIPSATASQLSSLNIATTLVIGDTAQVSNAVMAMLPGATRLGGADQYATSQAVAGQSVARGLPSNVVYVTDGARPMDAALLGAIVGRTTGIMLMTPAPVLDTAAGTAAAAGLSGIDRIVGVVQAPAAAPPPPPPGAPPLPPPPPISPVVPTCGSVKLVKRNASTTKRRVDTRVLIPCAGKLTATASTTLRVKGRLRAVRQLTTVKRLSGRNRAVRVTLSAAARSKLRRIGKVTITIRAAFVPTTLSPKAKASRKTITVTIRR